MIACRHGADGASSAIAPNRELPALEMVSSRSSRRLVRWPARASFRLASSIPRPARDVDWTAREVMGVTRHRWDDDQHILDDLSDVLLEATLASTIAEYGKGVYAWRTIDQDLLLAPLSLDTSLEPVQEGRADAGGGRVLVFTAPPLSLELEVMPGRLVGQIVPPGPGEIQVKTPTGSHFRSKPTTLAFSAYLGICAARFGCAAIPRRGGWSLTGCTYDPRPCALALSFRAR